jgi:trans-aconitate 2-methyltransferase
VSPEKVREWDAGTYQRVSVPHEEWAEAVLERLPKGRVIGVDGSRAMIEKVSEILRPQDGAFAADLTELELEAPVDAVLSSAVFHWIKDHDALFARMRAALVPGGRLAAQCGGAGNIDELRETTSRLAARQPYAEHLQGLEDPWHYAGAEETEARLQAAGFEEVRCWLQPWDVLPPEPFEFLRTICLAPYLDPLPEELRGPFVEEVLASEEEPLRLRYVRLNIDARAS